MAGARDDSDIRKTLQVHATAIGTLTNKVDQVEHKLSEHSSVLSRIEMAVTRHDATRPASFSQNLDVAFKLFVMASMAVTATIAVSVWASRPDTATQALQRKHDDERMARIERSLEKLSDRPTPEPKVVYRDRFITKAP